MEENYIYWMIRAFDGLEIHPEFLQYAVRLNPDFIIEEDRLENYRKGVELYLENYDGDDYTELHNHYTSGDYLARPILSKEEQQKAFVDNG